MKTSMRAAIVFAMVALPTVHAANPISQVIQMISDLQAKLLKEGTEAQKVYEEYAEFCEDRSKELGFEIKTGKESVATLTATIDEETATSASLTTKIEELAGAIGKDDKKLEEATALRKKDAADFAAEEKELMDAVDTLGRAIGILQKEMSKSGASMVQVRSATSVAKALKAMVEASMISTADSSKLSSLLQSSQADEDSDSDAGAPDPAVYKGQSGGIIDVMQGLFEKAEEQLAALRQKEGADVQNFNMLKQSLVDATKYAKKEKAEAEKDMAESQEKKAEAQKDLDVTSKDLAGDVASLAELHSDCMTKSSDFEDETNSRGEELKALATAKKLIVEATSLAQQSQEQDASFFQIASKTMSKNSQVVQVVRDLAKQQKSTALTQLASQLSSIVSFGSRSGEDVFAKVKGLINDMIAKLEAEAEADASKKAYCDKENAESAEKKDAKEAESEKLSTSIDTMEAKIATLGEEVSVLQTELGEIARAQSEMDKVRAEEKDLFDATKAELDKAIKGIKLALKALTDYYGQSGGDGSGASIISMLEVAESDFTKNLAETTSTEENAVAEYEKETKANEVATTSKEQDVKYKTKESKSLQKATAEAKEDLAGVSQELDAVNEYIAKLKEKCFPLPPESYEERVKRREAEVAGLKKALTILDGDAVLLQATQRHSLRRVQVKRT